VDGNVHAIRLVPNRTERFYILLWIVEKPKLAPAPDRCTVITISEMSDYTQTNIRRIAIKTDLMRHARWDKFAISDRARPPTADGAFTRARKRSPSLFPVIDEISRDCALAHSPPHYPPSITHHRRGYRGKSHGAPAISVPGGLRGRR